MEGDIYSTEAKTFDRCGAHPQNTGVYHYHPEPYALSSNDARFIGVMTRRVRRVQLTAGRGAEFSPWASPR